MTRKNKRQKVEQALLKGLSVQEIVEKYKVSYSLVYQVKADSHKVLMSELGYLINQLLRGIDFRGLTPKQQLDFYLRALELRLKFESLRSNKDDGVVIKIKKPDGLF